MDAELTMMFPGFTAERRAQGEAMWRREGARLRRLAPAPVAAAVLVVMSFSLLGLALPGSGTPFAIAADAATLGAALAFVPTVISLFVVQRDRAPALAKRTTAFGFVAAGVLGVAAAAALASDARLLTYQEPRPGAGASGLFLAGAALLGVWMLVAGCPGRSNWVLSRVWTWTGVLAGISLIITAPSFLLLGDAHPLTLGSGLAAAILLAVWLAWLGVTLIRGERGWRRATDPLLEENRRGSPRSGTSSA